MTQRRHLTLVSAGATVLAAMPLATVFDRWTWLVTVLLVVGAMTAVAVGLRSVRTPGWVPTAGMIATYALTLTWRFGHDHALLGVVPTPTTVKWFAELLGEAGLAIRDTGVPVGDEESLLFLAALGIGAVALAIDMAAVVARRPAIAGIPMVAIYIVAVGTHSDSVSFLSFVCTAAAFLWLLATDNVDRVRRFGRRFTGDGRDVDVWEPSPLAATGRRLAVIGVAVAVLLPLAVPGMTTGLLDRFGSGVGSGSGTGTGPGRPGAVNLFSLLSGSLIRDRSYDMVKVTTADPAPFYLRIGVADDLAPIGFTSRSSWGPGQPLSNIGNPPPPGGPGTASKHHTASVEILDYTEQLLPLYQHPTRFEKLDGAWQWDRRSGVVYSNRANAKGRKYNFAYVRHELTAEALRRAPQLGADDPLQQAYTRMPDVKAVRDKAAEIVRGKTTPYDKVRAIYDFFSPANGFRYNLTTTAGNSGSKIVDFLNNKEGYCEQYAAAMGWLVRAAGIPARVAFGFTRGSNRVGSTYTLNNYNLHAWTEVYLHGFDWVPFDATPASNISGSVSSAYAPDPTQPSGPSIPQTPDDLSAGAEASGGPSLLDPDRLDPNDQAAAAGGDGVGSRPRWPLYVIGGALLVLALLSVPALRRAALRRRRWPGPGSVGPPLAVGGDGARAEPAAGAGQRRTRREAHSAWDELVDTMIDFRVAVDPAETPRVTADRLIRERDLTAGAADGAHLLGRAEERARYAREPLADADLGTSLRAVRTALRARVSRRTRVIAAVLPRSVLVRWRSGLVGRYANTINAAGRRRDAITRAVSPRRLIANRPGR